MAVYAVESGCLGGFIEAYDKGSMGHGLMTFGSLVRDVWNPPPFSSLPPSPPSHSLWDMITNDEGISLEIWDQFIGGNVLSIAF